MNAEIWQELAIWKPLIHFFVMALLAAGFSLAIVPDGATGWEIARSMIRYGGLGGAAGIALIRRLGVELVIALSVLTGLAVVNQELIKQTIRRLTGLGANGHADPTISGPPNPSKDED